MVRIPNYFYSTDVEKQTLHRHIIPNEDQQKEQQTRWGELCDFLLERLAEKSGYQLSSWIQGSYKFGTQIRPTKKGDEFDIDLGIYFNWVGKSDEGNYSPFELKTFVQDSLVEFMTDNDDVIEVISPPKERCSRIRFTGDFHIDTPTYHLDSESDIRELATESNIWEKSDPKAFYLWFKNNVSNEDNLQVRRIVRYIKIWSHLQMEEPPSSMLLTVLVSEAYKSSRQEDLDGDDVAVKTIVGKIISRLETSSEVINPVNSKENLNRLEVKAFDTFLDKLRNLDSIAQNALNAPSEITSVNEWAKVFFHFFPAFEISSLSSGDRAIMSLRFIPEVSVTAIPKKNKFRQYNNMNRIGPIPPDCDITFFLTNSKYLPVGSHVQWMVRNEGLEAEYKNDLGHPAGNKDDQYMSKEESMYVGKHFMDITVTLAYGEIIGFRRIPVEIFGTFMPPRKTRGFHGPKKL